MNERLKDRVCNCGLRCTRQRETIYRALASTTAHPTAEELHRMVLEADEDLSLATVYNALDAFCAHGLCRRLPTSAGPARYDADVSDHLHVQDASGAIHDVPDELSQRFYESIDPKLMAEIGAALGLDISGARIELAAPRSD